MTTYDELREAVATGWAIAFWAGTTADEQKIQDDLKATIRAIPFDQPAEPGVCVLTGKPASTRVIFARSY